jgi:hypothetical protein
MTAAFLLAQMGGTLIGIVLCILLGLWWGRTRG